MNNKPQYNRDGSVKNTILKYLCANSILPYNMLSMLGKQETVQKAVHAMQRDGIVEIIRPNGKGDRKVVILSDYEKNKERYAGGIPEAYLKAYQEYGKEDVKNMKFGEPVRKDRIQSQAEARLLFHFANIPSFDGERPEIDHSISEYAYYTARDVKGATQYDDDKGNKDGIKKISGSRLTGWYISPGGKYAVLNIPGKGIKISNTVEYRMKYAIDTLLNRGGHGEELTSCIALYRTLDDIETAVRGEMSEAYRIGNLYMVYKNIYMVPRDITGMKLLQIMGNTGWRMTLRRYLVPESDHPDASVTVPCDGYNGFSGRYTLIGIVPCFHEIDTFVNIAEYKGDPEKYVIVCLPEQEQMYGNLCKGNVTIQTVELNQIVKDTDMLCL